MTSPTQRRHDEILGRLDALIDAMTPPTYTIETRTCHTCRKAERDSLKADVERLARERDFQTARADDLGIRVQKSEARHAALRGDVYLLSIRATTALETRPKLRDVLDRDDKRGRDA